MVEFVTLSAEDVKKANTYLPIAQKNRIVRTLSAGCIEEAEAQSDVVPMPTRWQESVLGKRLVLSYVMAAFYLRKVDGEALFRGEFNFSAHQYDTFSKVLPQLESMKRGGDAEVRDAVFAILSDFREFEKMLNAEIYNRLQSKNDVLTRLMAMLALQTSPEAIKNATAEMERLKQEAADEAKKMAEWKAGLKEKKDG